ncbi:hypothetical protein ACFYY8_06185 [Streptosporangium sp. NPDC001559]|uniref:DUF7736 domain-containing protein n=1 Tax=Streptosporangium sp. NPDC001559 TaxID=3366187 RepID=UPI0036EB8685
MSTNDETREFPLAHILTVTTNCQLVPAISELSPLLSFMAGEALSNVQLGRVAKESAGPILEQHPQLREVTIPAWINTGSQEVVDAWVAGLSAKYGAMLPLTPLAKVDHTSIDPVEEVLMILEQKGGQATSPR